MKKVFAFTLVMLLSSFIFVIPVSAANINATADFQGIITLRQQGKESGWDLTLTPEFDVSIPRQGNVTETFISPLYETSDASWNSILFSCNQFKVTSPDDSGFYGDVALYLSYFAVLEEVAVNSIPAGTWGTSSRKLYSASVLNGNNEMVTTANIVADYYDVDTNIYPSNSMGVNYSFKIRVPEATPILSISFNRESYDTVFWNAANINTGFKGNLGYVIPSAVLIADRTTAELEELENIADAIIEQNQISQEHYAEVMGKLDDLYTEVGNLADLQQEAIDQFDDWNIVSSVPGSVTDKTDQAEDVLDELHQLEKPEPDQIVPELDLDTTEIAQILEPYFQNTLILQILMMTLGFAFVSYVLFGKKG